jgi:hypothetical protein
MSRTQLERIASGDLDNMPIATAFAIEEEDNVQLAAAVADNRSRGQHAIVIQRNAPLTPTWIGERWSGNYPDGIFEWRWEDSPRHGPSLDTWGNENGTTGWAIIIRSSNADFPPGLYRVHQCAHMPCKCSFSPTSMFVGSSTPLHLFRLEAGISMQNVPQSRNAAEADAVAEPSPPSTPDAVAGPAGMRTHILHFSKCKKDKKSKKAETPKKIKNVATYTNNAKNKNKANGNGKGSGCMNVIAVPDAAMDGGQKIELAVEASDTIGDVKQHIFIATGIWQTNLHLIFAGKGLADGKTLAFYNIPDGSNLTYTSSAAVAAVAARRRVEKRLSQVRSRAKLKGAE